MILVGPRAEMRMREGPASASFAGKGLFFASLAFAPGGQRSQVGIPCKKLLHLRTLQNNHLRSPLLVPYLGQRGPHRFVLQLLLNLPRKRRVDVHCR